MLARASLLAATFALGCASAGGARHPLAVAGRAPLEVLVAGEEGESSEPARPVVPAWMLGPERPGDRALWAGYASRVLEAISRDPNALPAADREAREAMAREAPALGLPISSAYLREQLPAIASAGFLAEHAALELEGGGAAPQVPRERQEAYLLWRAKALPGMVPETEVSFLAGRRKLSRHAVPWSTAVLGLTSYLATALEKEDCAAVEAAGAVFLAGWAEVAQQGVALSMEGDERHLAYLKKTIQPGQDLRVHPVTYREAALASASCARAAGRLEDAASRARTATEMDPLCADCWVERSLVSRRRKDDADAAAAAARAIGLAESEAERAAVKAALEAP